jgi:hypothetical protein
MKDYFSEAISNSYSRTLTWILISCGCLFLFYAVYFVFFCKRFRIVTYSCPTLDGALLLGSTRHGYSERIDPTFPLFLRCSPYKPKADPWGSSSTWLSHLFLSSVAKLLSQMTMRVQLSTLQHGWVWHWWFSAFVHVSFQNGASLGSGPLMTVSLLQQW